MIKKDSGFTLIELLIAMVIFIIVIAATTRLFITTVGQFKQQGKITEAYIEGVIGFEQIRLDIKHAGSGLPWELNGATYDEAINDATTPHDDSLLNNTPGVVSTISAMPKAFASLNNAGLNGSDVLSIKAINVAISDASQKWTRVGYGDSLTTDARLRGLSGDDFDDNDRVIVISPGTNSTSSDNRILINTSYPTFAPTRYSTAAAPSDLYTKYIIYGIAPPNATTIRMPFNRADYYVRIPGTMPAQCAGGTGVLFKATVNHNGGGLTEYPLIDCVADMQVTYRFDMNNDGTTGTSSNANGTAITSTEGATTATVQATLDSAADLRSRLKEIRVYILAHEGQRDARYTFPDATVTVGDAALGQVFDFAFRGIANWQNYRWKVYELPVGTSNLK